MIDTSPIHLIADGIEAELKVHFSCRVHDLLNKYMCMHIMYMDMFI